MFTILDREISQGKVFRAPEAQVASKVHAATVHLFGVSMVCSRHLLISIASPLQPLTDTNQWNNFTPVRKCFQHPPLQCGRSFLLSSTLKPTQTSFPFRGDLSRSYTLKDYHVHAHTGLPQTPRAAMVLLFQTKRGD